jgi:hypothetical protein
MPEQRLPALSHEDEQHITHQEAEIMPSGFRPWVVRWLWVLSVLLMIGGLVLWMAAL